MILYVISYCKEIGVSMKLIDNDKFKNNKVGILVMLLVTVTLIILEYSITLKEQPSSLKDKEIQINALVINEVMASNKGALADNNGNIYDWIELYNGTDEDVDLTGYGLSDEESGHIKWIFPVSVIKSKEYLVIYLSGKADSRMHANFSLNKSGGETITLKRKNGKVVDSVRTVSLDKNLVMARNELGTWITTTEITPGYSNNEEGRKRFLDSLKLESDELEITEFLPANKGNILFDGGFYSYIEVRNKSEKEVSLRDYFVSNTASKPFLYRLPNKILKPNEVYLIYTSELGKENHANFSLNKKNGTVILSKKNKIVEQIDYDTVINGFAYIKDSNGIFHENTNISPGYRNEDIAIFAKEARTNPEELIISEVMSSNQSYLAQNGGEYYDWIELYNNTDHTLLLSEYTLTLSEIDKERYRLPDEELKSGEYYIIMASGNTNLSNSRYAHANFEISSSESIYLYHEEKLADSVFFSSIPVGYSYGRNSINGFYYFPKPTPGIKNSESDILEMPIKNK